MSDLKVALFEYDLSPRSTFDQVWLNRPNDADMTQEIRFSKLLWEYLLDRKDSVFNTTAAVYSDLAQIEQGIVGSCFGAKLTTEWVLMNASQMTPLPGYVYLHLYVPKSSVASAAAPHPVNLLHLAQQVTSP